MTNTQYQWTTLPSEQHRATAAKKVAEQAAGHDRIEALSEQFVLGLDDARLGHRHLLATVDDELAAVAAVDGAEAEMAVEPEFRDQGIELEIYDRLAAEVEGLQLWAHGNLGPAQAVAEQRSLEVVRRLLVMEITGDALGAAAKYEDREAMTALNLTDSARRWGTEPVEGAWLAANNEAFQWHPEQGGWDLDRLHRAMEADWFDAADVWFLWDTSEHGDVPPLAGFHWLKRHSAELAEVYVVGLSDAYRGKGLGGPIVSLGLAHLVETGSKRVILYTEDDNQAAVRRYEESGFTIAEEHVVYARHAATM